MCLDTFAGFTKDDIAVEGDRGHDENRYAYLFRAYRKEWFDQTMTNNQIERVTLIQTDVNTSTSAGTRASASVSSMLTS